jgi:hypothetical protein
MMNKIVPDSIKKFKQKGPAFLLMENVQSFLAAIKKYGVPDEEVFQTPDLFEARNIPQVTLCLYALARTTQKHPEYAGPQMGPKMSTENKREFSEEQIRKGRDGQVGLQVLNFQCLGIKTLLFREPIGRLCSHLHTREFYERVRGVPLR